MVESLRERLARSSYEFTVAHQKSVGDRSAFIQPRWEGLTSTQKKFAYALADWFMDNIEELRQ